MTHSLPKYKKLSPVRIKATGEEGIIEKISYEGGYWYLIKGAFYAEKEIEKIK